LGRVELVVNQPTEVLLIAGIRFFGSTSLVSNLSVAGSEDGSAKEDSTVVVRLPRRTVTNDASLEAESVWVVMGPPSEKVDPALYLIGCWEVDDVNERTHVCEAEQRKRMLAMLR
jgi:hypothetical protein